MVGRVAEEMAAERANSRFAHAWRALKHRNFKLFVSGQSLSVIGTWMTRLATSWLVYRLTGSALLLGVVGFSGQILTFLLAPFAGVWVERMDRRKLLVCTQTLAGLQSLTLAGLTLSRMINIRDVIVLASLQGLINAFDMPGRQAFLVKMVDDKEDLSNAIAINSSIVNLARMVGPALAGLVIAWVGEGYCFLIDGISYGAVILSLLMMKLRPNGLGHASTSMLARMQEGWAYVSSFKPVQTILLLFALTNLMGMPFSVLLPIFAGGVLHGGAHTLGFLTGASGAGALISAISLAMRKSVRGLTTMIQIAAGMFGAGLILLGFSDVLWLSMLLLMVVGFGMMQGMAASNTVIQTLVPEDKRARVMSYYTMAFVGMAPFGSLLAGYLAHHFGAPHTVMLNGSMCVLGSLWFTTQLPAVRKAMRPIYAEMGILAGAAEAEMEDHAGV